VLVGRGGREHAEKMAFEWGHPQKVNEKSGEKREIF